MHGWTIEFIAIACDEIEFTCRQIKQLLRFIYETIHLNFVTAYELPLFVYFSNSFKINCKMSYTCTKTSFPLFGYEQELRQSILPTVKEAVKSYLLVLYDTKQERGEQQPTIAEKSIAEVIASQLEQLCH